MKAPEASEGAKPLKAPTLRFSKRMVAMALMLISAGAAWVLSPWPYGMLGGVVFCASGFALFFGAGYAWVSDDESAP